MTTYQSHPPSLNKSSEVIARRDQEAVDQLAFVQAASMVIGICREPIAQESLDEIIYTLEDVFGAIDPTFVASSESSRCIADIWRAKGRAACQDVLTTEPVQTDEPTKAWTVPV